MSHANHAAPFHRHAELPLAEPFVIASQQRRVQSSVKHACLPPLPAGSAAGPSPLYVKGRMGGGSRGRRERGLWLLLLCSTQLQLGEFIDRHCPWCAREASLGPCLRSPSRLPPRVTLPWQLQLFMWRNKLLMYSLEACRFREATVPLAYVSADGELFSIIEGFSVLCWKNSPQPPQPWLCLGFTFILWF